MHFTIPNMVCGGCARGVTKAIQSVDPSAQVSADPPSHTVDVTTSATREQIVAALRAADFAPVQENA